MNRTIKEATVKRYHYDSHDQLGQHLGDFVAAYNFGRRLKTLKGLTPYEAICKAWQNEPDRFTSDPHHQMPGSNTWDGGARVDAIEQRFGNLFVVGLPSGQAEPDREALGIDDDVNLGHEPAGRSTKT